MGKVVKIAANVVVSVLAYVAATAIVATFSAALGPVGSLIAIALITAALVYAGTKALSAVGLGLRPAMPTAKNGTPTVFRQAITDSFIVYGKRRVGGLMAFFHARQVGKDHFRYFVIACAGHRCQGVVRWYLNDEVVTVDGAGKVTSGAYANNAWLWFQRGLASETANGTFVAECGGNWTSAHKGNGIAAIYAKFKMTDDIVQAGMPNITAEIEGRDEIFDPRDASTGYTNNAALVFYDWLKLAREEGGFGAYDDEIPDDDWLSAQANVCDEDVGSEPRYAFDSVIVTGATPEEIRAGLIVNCAGSFTYSGGKFLMRPGYYVPPVHILAEADLAGPITISPFLTDNEAANEVQGTYVDPSTGYQGSPFATQVLDPAPADVRQMDLDLAHVTSKTRGERVARIMLNRAQAEKTVQWPMNIVGLKVKTLDNLQLDSSRYGLGNYVFQSVNWGLSADFSIVLALREENAEIYDPPSPVSPSSVPAIVQATRLLTQGQAALLIGQSSTAPTRVLSASESGGTATVTVLEHDRVYPDGRVVHIDEQVFAGLTADTPYFPYYEDLSLSETAPTIVMTTDSAAPQGVPGAHSLGRIRTPVAASGIVYEGGGAYLPGATVGREVDGPTP